MQLPPPGTAPLQVRPAIVLLAQHQRFLRMGTLILHYLPLGERGGEVAMVVRYIKRVPRGQEIR